LSSQAAFSRWQSFDEKGARQDAADKATAAFEIDVLQTAAANLLAPLRLSRLTNWLEASNLFSENRPTFKDPKASSLENIKC
jgi:hypothetical protein